MLENQNHYTFAGRQVVCSKEIELLRFIYPATETQLARIVYQLDICAYGSDWQEDFPTPDAALGYLRQRWSLPEDFLNQLLTNIRDVEVAKYPHLMARLT